MSLGTILLIILVIFLFGGFANIGSLGPGYGYGYYGQGLPLILIIVVVILLVTGRI
jgi:hypothetical protein